MPFGLSGINFPAYREWDVAIVACYKRGKPRSLRVINIITIQYLYTAPACARESSNTIKTAGFCSTFPDSPAPRHDFLQTGFLLGKRPVCGGSRSVVMQRNCCQCAAKMQVESGRDAHAISAKGAMGLMQIMPATWQGLQHDLGLGADPFDPQDNILAGASYLRMLHDRYGDAGFLAAYNAGPGRYEAHLATGRPLPQETRDYVASVAELLDGRTLSADVLHNIDVTVARNQPEDTLFAGHVIWRSSGAFPHAPKALADMSQALFVPVSMGPAP